MANNGITVPSHMLYRPFSEDQVRRLHGATLELLETTGVEVSHPGALQLFKDRGARVDEAKKRVYLSPTLVEDAVNTAPSTVLLAARDPKHDLVLEGTRVYLGGGGVCEKVVDLTSGEKRPAAVPDIAAFARLGEALENVHFLQFIVNPRGLPEQNQSLHHFWHIMRNSTKHVMGEARDAGELAAIIRLAETLSGWKAEERPTVSFINCLMISPLKMDSHVAPRVMDAAAAGLPQALPTAPVCGVTAPITLAGTALLQNAESLAAVVFTQLVRPGAPVLYSIVSSVADMSTLTFMFGAVEMGILAAAGAQMARFYGLPVYATGGTTEDRAGGQQAGYEKALTLLTAALSGANFIHDTAGLLESVFTASFEQMVIDNEINGMVLQVLRGVDFSEDKLALPVIQQAGPGGNFLLSPHTRQYLRQEHFLPKVSDRLKESAWRARGEKELRQRAREEAQRILNSSGPALPAATELALQKALPELYI